MRHSIVAIFCVGLLSCSAAVESSSRCAHRATSEDHVVCTLFPESTEGPYFVEDMDVRRNITEGKPGVQIELAITVVNFTTCEPLVNVPVDIWSCDGMGEYSSFIGATLPPLIGPEGDGIFEAFPKDNNTFLRGVQYTDEDGVVIFHSLYPGWYPGRAIHIHVTAHVNGQEHTGQLYFEEDLSEQIELLEPYSSNPNRRVTNNLDIIYNLANGTATTLKLTNAPFGYTTAILMGVDK